jgi:hypothetical protein
MEDVSPSLILLWDVKRALEKGQSLSVGVKNFLNRPIQDEFLSQVNQWWLSQSHSQNAYDKKELRLGRRQLLEILELGLKGQSILETLKSFEKELITACEDEIQRHLARLPFILMFPLMGLIFPALMLLLIGPLLSQLNF